MTQQLVEQVVLAKDLEPGILYQTHKTTGAKHRSYVDKKHDPLEEQVEINFYEHQYNRCWMEARVPLDYPFIKLDGDIHHNESRDSKDVLPKRGMKRGGKISGLSMMECWGLYFRKWVGEPAGRAQIVHDMCLEFPDKVDSIMKWVDSYKSYYKMGKLPGCIKQDKKVEWIEAKYKARIVNAQTLLDPLALLEDENG